MVFSVVFKSRMSQDQKPWFLAKNCSFQCGFQMWEEPKLKTAVFSVVFKSRRSQGQKPWFSAPKTAVFKSGRSLVKNCSFYRKPQFSVWFSIVGGAKAKNCSFQPKTTVISVVFNCGRSQGLKLPKTMVFGRKLWFSVWFSIVGGAKV